TSFSYVLSGFKTDDYKQNRQHKTAPEVNLAELCRVLGLQPCAPGRPQRPGRHPQGAGGGDGPPRAVGDHYQPAVLLIKDASRFTPGPRLCIDPEKCDRLQGLRCASAARPSSGSRPPTAQKGKACIDPLLCNGCTVCQQLCKFDAIIHGQGKNDERNNHQHPAGRRRRAGDPAGLGDPRRSLHRWPATT
ncbi:MAG: hypothetical protein MZU79_01310, partial [Anaerotruncus sp.]|nr:hypothetical protein [Anaerotruncus sp.]